MLQEIVTQAKIDDFTQVWARITSLAVINDMLPKSHIAVYRKGGSLFDVRSMEVFSKRNVSVVCCYDAAKNGRFFIEVRHGMAPEVDVDKHYVLADIKNRYTRQQMFCVHITGAEQRSGDNVAKSIRAIQAATGWPPIFIGAHDKFAIECFEACAAHADAVSLIGKSPSMLSTICLLQQARAYFGTASGEATIAEMLKTPAFVIDEQINDTSKVMKWIESI